jgi:hypothetical protein
VGTPSSAADGAVEVGGPAHPLVGVTTGRASASRSVNRNQYPLTRQVDRQPEGGEGNAELFGDVDADHGAPTPPVSTWSPCDAWSISPPRASDQGAAAQRPSELHIHDMSSTTTVGGFGRAETS